MAQQYAYIILNDGTKWRYRADKPLTVASGPYRATSADSEKITLPLYKGTASAPSSKAAQKTSASRQTSAADKAAVGKAAETAAVRKAELEAEQKEKEHQQKIAAINSSKDEEIKYLGQNFAREKDSQELLMEDNMRNLYIAYMNGLKGIPQQSALWGAGGEIESLKNRSRLNYENNRAKEQHRYAGALSEIEQKYNKDLRELESRYLQRLLNL